MSPDALSLSSDVAASPDQVSCELTDDAVILGLEDGIYYGLNPVAARVWSLLDRPRKVEEIRDRLLEEYDVTAERCTAELLELLEELRSHGLLELSGEPIVTPTS